jgi:hypothetical protein
MVSARKPSNTAAYVVICVWLAFGGYLAVSGWIALKVLQETAVSDSVTGAVQSFVEYRGISFRDAQEAMKFIQEQRSEAFAPWMFLLPYAVVPLVASVGWGILGGAVRLLKVMALSKASVPQRSLFSDPLFGGVIGLTVVLVAWAVPSLLTTSTGPMRPESIAALSICGGFFSEQAFLWLENAAKQIFKT